MTNLGQQIDGTTDRANVAVTLLAFIALVAAMCLADSKAKNASHAATAAARRQID